MSPPKKKKKGKNRDKKDKKSSGRREAPPESDSLRKPKRILHQKVKGPTNEDISIATPKKSNSTHGRNDTPSVKLSPFDEKETNNGSPLVPNQKGALAKFLEGQAACPSDEDEAGGLSKGAQSMPTCMHSYVSEERQERDYAYDDLVLESARRKQKNKSKLNGILRKTKYSFSFDEKVTNNDYDISRHQACDRSKEGMKCIATESYQLGKLALFLRDITGPDEDERDNISRGVKSMPTHIGPVTLEKGTSRYNEVMSIAESFKVNESFSSQSDELYDYGIKPILTTDGKMESLNESSFRRTEIARVDSRISALQDLRDSLRLEYETMYEKAMKAEKKVKMTKLNVSNLQFEIAQLQVQLDKEQALLIAAENARQAHNKSLTAQEKKINDINLERNQFIERKNQLMAEISNEE